MFKKITYKNKNVNLNLNTNPNNFPLRMLTKINETSGQQWNKFFFIAINKHIDQKARQTYVSKTKNFLN